MKSSIGNFAVFDIETTGLKEDKHAMIEIAICPFDIDLKDLPIYESGIIAMYDNREIVPKALEANGISMKQIEEGRNPAEVAKEIKSFLTKLKIGSKKAVMCGHNIDKFDIPFLDNFLSFFGVDLEKLMNFNYTIDSMWRCREIWPESENYKLGTCCSNFGIELVNGHRALADTQANKELVKSIIKRERQISSEKVSSSVSQKRYRTAFQF